MEHIFSRIDLTFTKQDLEMVLKDKTASAIPVKNLMEQRYIWSYTENT